MDFPELPHTLPWNGPRLRPVILRPPVIRIFRVFSEGRLVCFFAALEVFLGESSHETMGWWEEGYRATSGWVGGRKRGAELRVGEYGGKRGAELRVEE